MLVNNTYSIKNPVIEFDVTTQFQDAVITYYNREGVVLLTFPYKHGDPDVLPVSGNVHIEVANASKNVASIVYHYDYYKPLFTADVPIYIVQANGSTRLYAGADDALNEYVEGVVNTFYIARDNNLSAASQIQIIITQE